MIIRILLIAMVWCVAYPAYALEDIPPAVPAPVVKSQPLPLPAPKQKHPPTAPIKTKNPAPSKVFKAAPLPASAPTAIKGKGFYVLELFSSQACTFCPRADAMMATYAAQPSMIALSCHIDYFDVKEGSLALPLCSVRQKSYELTLDIGPKYTPQMVVNGQYDAVGYLPKEIAAAFAKVRSAPVSPLNVEALVGGLYRAKLPDVAADKYSIWLFVYDAPHSVLVKDGGNAGKRLTYYNVVSKAGFLGSWDGKAKDLKFDAKLDPQAKGFALLVQSTTNNAIILAAKVE
tara:strand:- start:1488 stop:2351 length:864 start_codon:yes stop_codon:yes gene_type:complete